MAKVGQRQRVWDLPTRIFHWVLVALLGFSWWSGETHRMEWHQYSGIAVCGLVIFRILWGFFGTSTSRFAHFLKGPRAIWSYVRPADSSARSDALGHNPLGGWSVIALLMLVCVQVVSGLFAVDVDGIESGPLSYLVDFDQGRFAAEVHEVSFNLLMALVVLHVLAVLFYLLVKRRNLTWVMVTGFQPTEDGNDSAAARLVPRWRLVAAAIASAALAYGVASGFRF